jgi:hypothetical protein
MELDNNEFRSRLVSSDVAYKNSPEKSAFDFSGEFFCMTNQEVQLNNDTDGHKRILQKRLFLQDP